MKCEGLLVNLTSQEIYLLYWILNSIKTEVEIPRGSKRAFKALVLSFHDFAKVMSEHEENQHGKNV